MAQQIQEAVKQVTDKPILYLVNTNFHGDHTFGNYAFPVETRVVGHLQTARRMADFEEEKQLLLPAINDDPAALAQMRLRLPDVVFTDFLQLDLGGRAVEVHHFGPGNTPGDTVVYVPEAQVAWTGNLVVGQGTIPPLFEGRAGAYLETMARFARTLDVKTVVPGHGAMTSGKILTRYLTYLSELIQAVRWEAEKGRSLEETLANMPLWERYAPPANSPLANFLAGLHKLNLQRTYLEVAGQ